MDVLERVSWILKDFGFYPTEEGFDIGSWFMSSWYSFCISFSFLIYAVLQL